MKESFPLWGYFKQALDQLLPIEYYNTLKQISSRQVTLGGSGAHIGYRGKSKRLLDQGSVLALGRRGQKSPERGQRPSYPSEPQVP